MRKIAVLVLALGLIALTGCNVVKAEPAQTDINKMIGETFNKLADDQWAVLGFVEISNYRPGAEVEQTIYLLNNIKTVVTEVKLITTFEDEREAEIPINRKLHGNDVASIVEITSSLENEHLKAESYNFATGMLLISGFIPESIRTASLTYKYDSQFTFSVTNDQTPRRGYRTAPDGITEWVTFDDPAPWVQPNAAKPVIVNLKTPENAELPNRWEFWIVVADNPVGAQLNQQIEYKIPWTVDMR